MEKMWNTTKEMNAEEYKAFNEQMNWLAGIKWEGYTKTLRNLHLSYLGNVNSSSKIRHNLSVHVYTYCLYLSAANNCGIEVCGGYSKNCRCACLVSSGHAKIDALSGKHGIEFSRNLKTRLFFANREVFMKLMEHEIIRAKARAEKDGFQFSMRINCCSDLNLELFKFGNKNIFEKFDDVQIYEYTKNPNYLKFTEKYKNYDVTFSRDGSPENDAVCMDWLKKGGNVAVVFGTTNESELPKTWRGYGVLNGQEYDARYLDKLDPTKQIVGLTYKVTKTDFKKVGSKNVFQGIPDIPFIVKLSDPDCKC